MLPGAFFFSFVTLEYILQACPELVEWANSAFFLTILVIRGRLFVTVRPLGKRDPNPDATPYGEQR